MYNPVDDTFSPKTAKFTQRFGAPIFYYLIDVLSDDRMGDAAYDVVYKELNNVASEEVQRYAFEQYARAHGIAGLSGKTPRFVMQIQDVDYTTNGTSDWTRRYCLVLKDDTNLLERLRRAYAHAEASITANNIEPAKRTEKSIKKIEQQRHWFLTHLEHAIQLEEEAELRRARGGADSNRSNYASKSNDARRQRIFAYAGAPFPRV